MRCPKCGNNSFSGIICKECGFDFSVNRTPFLSRIDAGVIEAINQSLESERKKQSRAETNKDEDTVIEDVVNRASVTEQKSEKRSIAKSQKPVQHARTTPVRRTKEDKHREQFTHDYENELQRRAKQNETRKKRIRCITDCVALVLWLFAVCDLICVSKTGKYIGLRGFANTPSLMLLVCGLSGVACWTAYIFKEESVVRHILGIWRGSHGFRTLINIGVAILTGGGFILMVAAGYQFISLDNVLDTVNLSKELGLKGAVSAYLDGCRYSAICGLPFLLLLGDHIKIEETSKTENKSNRMLFNVVSTVLIIWYGFSFVVWIPAMSPFFKTTNLITLFLQSVGSGMAKSTVNPFIIVGILSMVIVIKSCIGDPVTEGQSKTRQLLYAILMSAIVYPIVSALTYLLFETIADILAYIGLTKSTEVQQIEGIGIVGSAIFGCLLLLWAEEEIRKMLLGALAATIGICTLVIWFL